MALFESGGVAERREAQRRACVLLDWPCLFQKGRRHSGVSVVFREDREKGERVRKGERGGRERRRKTTSTSPPPHPSPLTCALRPLARQSKAYAKKLDRLINLGVDVVSRRRCAAERKRAADEATAPQWKEGEEATQPKKALCFAAASPSPPLSPPLSSLPSSARPQFAPFSHARAASRRERWGGGIPESGPWQRGMPGRPRALATAAAQRLFPARAGF